MAMSVSKTLNRGGRPRTDATPIMVRVMPPDVSGLDAYIAAHPDPKPSRPEAIRLALRDWLTGLGYLPATSGEAS